MKIHYSITAAIAVVTLSSVAALLTNRPANAQFGGALPSFVKLQATTPGIVQNGHSNINGTAIAGFVSGGTTGVKGTHSGTGNYAHSGFSSAGLFAYGNNGDGIHTRARLGNASALGAYNEANGNSAYLGTDKAIAAYGNNGAGVEAKARLANATAVIAINEAFGNYAYIGTDKAIAAYGNNGDAVEAKTKLANKTAVVALNEATGNYAYIGTDKAIAAYGNTGDAIEANAKLANKTAVVAINEANGNSAYLGTNAGLTAYGNNGDGIYAKTRQATTSAIGGLNEATGNYAYIGTQRAGLFAYGQTVDGIYAQTADPNGAGVGGYHLPSNNYGYLGLPGSGVLGAANYPNHAILGLNLSGSMRFQAGNTSEDGGAASTISGAGALVAFFGHLLGFPSNGAAIVTDFTQIGQAGVYVDVDGSGHVFGDVKSFRVRSKADPDTDIVYACVEGPEAAAYIRGTGTLVQGVATITFPDHFKEVAVLEGMTVQLTPCSENSKGLAITRKSIADGILVKELYGGKGNYSFDYLVTCVRQGHENFKVKQGRMYVNADGTFTQDKSKWKPAKAMAKFHGP